MVQTIIVLSCKRSGHHAIINWLLANYNHGLPVNIHLIGGYNYAPARTNKAADIIYYNDCDPKQTANTHFAYHNIPRPASTRVAVYSFEDVSWSEVYSATQWLQPDRYLVICRDAINLIASRSAYIVRHHSSEMIVDHRIGQCWLSQVEIQPIAASSTQSVASISTIWYHRWLLEPLYRQSLCYSFDLVNYDQTTDVASEGLGSSFLERASADGSFEDTRSKHKDQYFQRYTRQAIPQHLHTWLLQQAEIHEKYYPQIYQAYLSYVQDQTITKPVPVKYFQVLATLGRLQSDQIQPYSDSIYYNYWLYTHTRKTNPNYPHLIDYLLPIADKLSEANYRLVEYYRSRGQNDLAHRYWLQRNDLAQGDICLIDHLHLQYKMEGSIILWYQQQYLQGFLLLDTILLNPDLAANLRTMGYNNLATYRHVMSSGLKTMTNRTITRTDNQDISLALDTISHYPLRLKHNIYTYPVYDRNWQVCAVFQIDNTLYWLVQVNPNYYRWLSLNQAQDKLLALSTICYMFDLKTIKSVQLQAEQIIFRTTNQTYSIGRQQLQKQLDQHYRSIQIVPTKPSLTYITDHNLVVSPYAPLLATVYRLLAQAPGINQIVDSASNRLWFLGPEELDSTDVFWARWQLYIRAQKLSQISCLILTAEVYQGLIAGQAFSHRYVHRHQWRADKYYAFSLSALRSIAHKIREIEASDNLHWPNQTIEIKLN